MCDQGFDQKRLGGECFRRAGFVWPAGRRGHVGIGHPGDESDRDLLALLYQGFDDATVARRLGVSHRTVQRRVRRIMSDLGVSGRFALGAKAQELGLILDIARSSNSRGGGSG
ncbi:hypothetical protein SHKM778_03390 [Streptomyces sp. KM77-8]|uniref:HTH luxR-type domain-containing protein n=1 Tax=Streptomyces haneummycinicus TaxID=3074435 RepID=A0AAT9H9A1_9ACTN